MTARGVAGPPLRHTTDTTSSVLAVTAVDPTTPNSPVVVATAWMSRRVVGTQMPFTYPPRSSPLGAHELARNAMTKTSLPSYLHARAEPGSPQPTDVTEVPSS